MDAVPQPPHTGRPAWTTWATWALMVVAAATAALAFTVGAPLLAGPVEVAAAVVICVAQLAMALVVARRAPGNAIAVLLAATGLITFAVDAIRTQALTPALAGDWMLLYLPLALILLIVPTGHAASPRWHATGWTLCAVVGAFQAVVVAQTIWPRAADALGILGAILLPVFFGLLVACTVAPIARYRRADEQARLRLRWVLVAGLSLPLTLLLCWASYLVLGRADLVVFGLLIMLVAIPAGATVAVTRPLLFDIDRVVVAAVSALSLTAAALTVLSLAGAAVGRPLARWQPALAAAVAIAVTLVCVAAFPFARRAFDRMLYPERARTVAALGRLSARVDAGDAQPEDLQDVLREALRDPGLVVAYRRLADRSLVGLDGAPLTASGLTAAVRARGEEIGAIVPSPDRIRRPAAAIARAAAPLLDAVRARSELALAAAEIEASRERMLRAGYDERRRLERDLHDGAQQRLVALGMQLRVLQRGSAPDAAVAASLDAAVAQLGTAVAELRQLAHGVRPSALDDGLGAALADLEQRSPDVVEIDVRAGELPDAVATTAYFVVNEAVANALRHAAASRIRVQVRAQGGELLVRVSDDGRGGASARGGLVGLSDRVEALGGSLQIDSPVDAGTTVEARIPCAS